MKDRPNGRFSVSPDAWCSHRPPQILEEARKFGLGLILSHQLLSQLRLEGGERVYESVMKSTRVKIAFGIADQEEAETLAYNLIDLDLEKPKRALDKPVVTGQRRIIMHGGGGSEHAMRQEGGAEAYTTGSANSTAEIANWANLTGESAGQVLTPEMGWLSAPEVLRESLGTNLATVESGGSVSAHMESESMSRSRNWSEAKGTTASRNWREAFEPILTWLPSATYSLAEMRYLAGRFLCNIKPRFCYVRFMDKASLVELPTVHSSMLSDGDFANARRELIRASGAARTRAAAEAAVAAREAALIAKARPSPPYLPDPSAPEPMPITDQPGYAEGFWERLREESKPPPTP